MISFESTSIPDAVRALDRRRLDQHDEPLGDFDRMRLDQQRGDVDTSNESNR